MNDVSLTIQHYLQGFRDLFKRKPLFYVALPGLLTWLLLYLLYSWSSGYMSGIESWVISKYPFDAGSGTIAWIIDKFSILVYFGGFIFFFKYILFIVMSPFMSLLSEDIEHDLGHSPASSKFKFSIFISDIIRGIKITLRNFWREFVFMAILFLLSFIPGVQIITAPLIFIVQAYYAGFGNMDYTLERYFNVKESANFVKRNKIMAVSNGSFFLLLLAIPVIGWFLAVPVATSAATRSVLYKLKRS